MDFLKEVPTVWDETRVLDAKVGDYILMARRKGETWYVGAMTDWSPRSLELDLGFLENGNFTMQVWKDGVNANRHAADFKQEKQNVSASSKIKIDMAPGGGWAAIINKNSNFMYENIF
jgi:alpha-glucosidase